MTESPKKMDELIRFFREREKELECIYRIEEILKAPQGDVALTYDAIVAAIPPGWQHPEVCTARLSIGTDTYCSPGFVETPWAMSADITVQGKKAGEIAVYYTKEMPLADDGPFLTHEARLLKAIADRLGSFVLHKRVELAAGGAAEPRPAEGEGAWEVILDLLRQTDPALFATVSEKMLNILCWSGVEEAERLRERAGAGAPDAADEPSGLVNRPHERNEFEITKRLSNEIFAIAAEHYTDDQILAYLRKWIQDDNLKFLMRVASRNLTLVEIIDALRQYRDMSRQGVDLSLASKRGVVVSLITRFLSSQPSYIRVAKGFCDISDFFEFLDRIIYTADSHGKLGGKTAGLFLAKQILRKAPESTGLLTKVKTPKSWYIASDVLLSFLSYNNMDEVVEQKYKDINDVRREYPHVIQAFKNGRFPPEIVQGLSVVLDDFEDRPLIVRSSSLLEDSSGAAFSGKYRSLFIANQGTKQERLDALMDAIAEVYASIVGPDPIEYRAERGLLDINEEMGIMIQEVVGRRVGHYFFPAVAGVAFSRNEFRWSPRIRREDGLIRMVPGLGTRAVDRVSDDYPVLVAPGQPGLRVNVAPEEIVYYSPKKIDVINLETNSFETIEAKDLLARFGQEVPLVEKLVSVYDGEHLRTPLAMSVDFESAVAAFTFEGLISDSHFVRQVDGILKVLEAKLGTPVDIEFAHDGTDFYLLQCRPQSFGGHSAPAPIPKDIPKEAIVFSANRYVSNGRIPDITHVVYVDPEKYSDLPERADLIAVGRAVGMLNKLLPKRRFILMGPGRWGSRGDVKLGVSVTYSDINRTAALIEIARRKGNYTPDLSFGTHFFQDLVEGQIRYLPLYPDDEGIVFNEAFLHGAPNMLADVLPDCAELADTVRLIDVPHATGGKILRVLMNAELNEAIGILTGPGVETDDSAGRADDHERAADQSSTWRQRMSEYIASLLDAERFGVVGMYVFGSTKNASAGLKSDIDILVHFRGTERQRDDLKMWLEGWSLCLDEMNFLRTGYRTGGLLDVHIVTDEDIANKTSYAVRIGAVTDAARPLALMRRG
jgi:pyruvate,water dikinase